MSLINGLSNLGSGLNLFAGNAAKDAEAQARVSLLNSAQPAQGAATTAADPGMAPAPVASSAASATPPAPDAVAAGSPPPSAKGAPVALSSIHPELTGIAAPGGAKFTVATSAADKFQGLINDLEAGGYQIDPKVSGGYNPRVIAGTNTPSQHAYGLAIDVNSDRNAQGAKTASDIPADVARALASKYGLTWGGDWHGSTRDPMHFEVAAGHTNGGAS